MFQPDPPETSATPRLAVILATVFAGAVACGLWRHEMWLDELQAWLIAFRSGSPLEMLRNMAYEGHPPLWHLILHGLGRAWPDPRVMQVASGLAAVATVFLVAWRSPLTPSQKALFAGGYYPLFEYGVISRSYGLGMALIAVFCAVRWSGVRSWLALALPLGLLGLTSLFGLIVAWGLALVVALDAWDEPADRPAWPDLVAGAVTFLGLTALSLRLMVPPADATFASGWRWGHDGWATSAVIGLWRAFFPIPVWGEARPWNTNLLQPDLIPVEFQLSGLLMLVLTASLRASPMAMAGWLAGAAVMLLFTWLRWGEAMRHAGHYFLLWLACHWIARPARGAMKVGVDGLVTRLRGEVDAMGPGQAEHGYAGPALVAGAVALGMFGLGLRAIAYMAAYFAAVALAATSGLVPGLRRLWAAADALRPGGFALSMLLTIQAGVGLRFWFLDVQGPFSAGKALAGSIAQLPDGHGPLVVADTRYVNSIGPVLAAFLDRDVSYVSADRRREGSWLVWSRDRPSAFEPEPGLPDVVARVVAGMRPGERLLFVTETPVDVFPPGVDSEVVAMAGGALQRDEPGRYHVYRLRKVR